MNINTDKITILTDIKNLLLNMLNQAKSAISDAQAEANSHIGAMQSRYDTFKEEAQYLATAQQLRAINIEQKILQCDHLLLKLANPNFKFQTIEVGAFFSVANHENNIKKFFFITPDGNGTLKLINNQQTMCVSIDAPIIKQYIGLTELEEPDTDAGEDEYIDFLK